MASRPTATPPGPAQTVGRAVQLLRLVASSRARTLRLVDLAEMTGLDKSTAHRLLQRLVQERLLVRAPGGRVGWRPGPLLHELGLAAPPALPLQAVARPALQRLADATGDMVFLLGRSGTEAVCLDRVEGRFGIATMTVGLGDRHPLGVGAGGLALLAALPPPQAAEIVQAVAPQLPRYGLNATRLRRRLLTAVERGHALDEGVAAEDVTALGRALHAPGGEAVGAVFVASIKRRMTPSALLQADRALRACVQATQAALAAALAGALADAAARAPVAPR